MGKLFGTDGVRGVANTELTPELAFALGRAGAYVLTKERHHSPKIILGMDTRISGDLLESALTSGMCSMGATVYIAGVVPTPCIAYLVRRYSLDAGVMISASHNPYQDNGIKFFNSQGYKLADYIEEEIETAIEGGLDALPRPDCSGVGTRRTADEALEDYIEFLSGIEAENETEIKIEAEADIKAEDKGPGGRLNGLKVALDCANGATFQAAPWLFESLGASVSVINNEPNGLNINEDCGSTHIGGLIKHVLETGADVGFAFDGDGDRCLMVDEFGKVVDGDEVMSICGAYLKNAGRLKQDVIVATVMSNLGFFIMGEKNGIKIEKTNVGDRFVLERMLENGYNFGGEQSGHIIFLDHNTTGDGLVTALMIASIMKVTGKTLSQLNVLMETLPQVLLNARVDNSKKDMYDKDERILSAIDAIERKYRGGGRVLIRASGTEPLVRVMIEGRDKAELERDARELVDLIEDVLGRN